MAGYRPRVLDAVLAKRLVTSGVVLLEGSKACGKTSTAEQVAASAVYLQRDAQALEALQIDPSLVLSGVPPQLVDEWQLDATRVWNHVRAEVDSRRAKGQFILTGSSVPVADDIRHSGSGRVARLRMRPMSLFESGDATGEVSLRALFEGDRPHLPTSPLDIPDVAHLVVRGGWPDNVAASPEDADQFVIDYLRNAVEVDIPEVDDKRRDRHTATRVMLALARNTSADHKIARIAEEVAGKDEAALARTTLYDVIPVLERLMLLELQPAWGVHVRSSARLNESSRTHFVDPSLSAAALGVNSRGLLKSLRTLGLLFESLVLRDMRVCADPLNAEVSYYRDKTQLEADVIVQLRDGSWGAFEVKLGNATDVLDKAAANLVKLAQRMEAEEAGKPSVLAIITGKGLAYQRPDGVYVLPVGYLGP